MNIAEYIEKQIVEYLDDVSVDKRYGYNLVIADNIYNELSQEHKTYLRRTMSTECKGRVIHNNFIEPNCVCIVDMKLNATSPYRVTKLLLQI